MRAGLRQRGGTVQRLLVRGVVAAEGQVADDESAAVAARHLVQTGARSDELQRAALGNGMRTLRQDGSEKVLAGITVIEEVRANSN